MLFLSFMSLASPKASSAHSAILVLSLSFSFSFWCPRFSLRSSSSCLRLLPRLPITSLLPSTFPSITCFSWQFLCQMWPIYLTFHLYCHAGKSTAAVYWENRTDHTKCAAWWKYWIFYVKVGVLCIMSSVVSGFNTGARLWCKISEQRFLTCGPRIALRSLSSFQGIRQLEWGKNYRFFHFDLNKLWCKILEQRFLTCGPRIALGSLSSVHRIRQLECGKNYFISNNLWLKYSFSFRIECREQSHLWPVDFRIGDRGRVAQRLRCCATNRKVSSSIPDGVIGIFHWRKILPIALWPWDRLSL